MDSRLHNFFNGLLEKSAIQQETCINENKDFLLHGLVFLQTLKHHGTISPAKIDKIVSLQIFPCFANIFQPHRTTGDGSCLWNMISICLVGDESLTKILRGYTFVTILKYKQKLQAFINQSYPDEKVAPKIEEILETSMKDNAWGGEYHLLAISTFLIKKIFVYSSFRERDKFFLKGETATLKELENAFKSKKTRVGFHIQYCPIREGYWECCYRPAPPINIYGFFHKQHYTALIPKHEKKIFVPKTNLFMQD